MRCAIFISLRLAVQAFRFQDGDGVTVDDAIGIDHVEKDPVQPGVDLAFHHKVPGGHSQDTGDNGTDRRAIEPDKIEAGKVDDEVGGQGYGVHDKAKPLFADGVQQVGRLVLHGPKDTGNHIELEDQRGGGVAGAADDVYDDV